MEMRISLLFADMEKASAEHIRFMQKHLVSFVVCPVSLTSIVRTVSWLPREERGKELAKRWCVYKYIVAEKENDYVHVVL